MREISRIKKPAHVAVLELLRANNTAGVSAIASTLAGRHKLVLVVDAEGRLEGVVDHDDILRGLVEPPAAGETSPGAR